MDRVDIQENWLQALPSHIVLIPQDALSPDVLTSLLQEFASRDGTDYGEIEVNLETKVRQLEKLLNTNEAFIMFDSVFETTQVIDKASLIELIASGDKVDHKTESL